MMATETPTTVQDWLDRLLAAAPADMNMVAIHAMQDDGIALERVVCTRHSVTDRWTGMARHLREIETDWQQDHLGTAHLPGDLRPWRQSDAPVRAPWETSTCRTCGATVIWAITPRGKRMPVDADPAPTGNVVLVASSSPTDPPRIVMLHTEDEQSTVDPGQRRTSHFATCAHADTHRRPR